MSLVYRDFVLRPPEPKDAQALYAYLNDPEVTRSLGGFRLSISQKGVDEWIDVHRTIVRDAVWVVAGRENDECLGHAGLYNIDQRIRKAELGVCLGARKTWGRGLGTQVYAAVLDVGFKQLNLHRIETFNLAVNTKTEHIKQKLGFKLEGTMRDSQYKDGQYMAVNVWAILEADWTGIDIASFLKA